MRKIPASLIALAATAAALGVLPFLSRADIATSTHFLVQDSYVGFFAGISSSTDFMVVSGGTPIVQNNATSADFGARTGPVNYSSFAPAAYTWRWYGDANDEKPTSSLAAENTAPSNVGANAAIKLRIDIGETGGVGATNVKYGLQYSTYSDFSAGVGTVTEIGACTATSTWCYAAVSGGGADNAVVSSTVLSTSGPCVAGVGTGCGTHNTSGVSVSAVSQAASSTTEYEFTVEGYTISAGSAYFFRPIYMSTGLPVPVYATSSYPSLVTQGATMSFSVSGLPQGTSTAGIVTSVSSTATAIPFGTLALATSVYGGQQLTITTNASNGYELYALEDAPLSATGGYTVPGVSSTNASPLSWSTACAATASACYGYHPTSPVLSGGSTRFAANDTYAALTSTAAEVGYAGAPASSSTMNIVYRLQTGPTQIAGNYQNNIIYIVAPSY